MSDKSTKYIFVTGGVLSGLGKGITMASIGNILSARGFSVNAQKLDPYLNVDAGTLNPAEHGECYVTKDGAETDLDLGHYERFLDVEMTQASSTMSGRLLRKLINDEREGKYLGKTVQVVPHFTTAIQDAVLEAGDGYDFHLVEIGGTVGDAESPAFFEAIREMPMRVGAENCMYVQVVYLPYLGASKETKTKPAQNAVKELRGLGITPDIVVARSELDPPNKDKLIPKLAMFTGVDEEGIAILPNSKIVYEVPLKLEKTGIGNYIIKRFGLKHKEPNMREWREMVAKAKNGSKQEKSIAVVAKYLDNEDTYISVFEALKAASWKNGVSLNIDWVDAEALENVDASKLLKDHDGIVVPGGFGSRGVEGKIAAAEYAIKNKVPYLGLCLGMQVGVIAMARMSGYKKANSPEVDPDTPDPVIHIMSDQKNKAHTGGTMRLGNYECVLNHDSISYDLYNKTTSVQERHRHRYEFNNKYRKHLEENGLIVAGESPDGNLVELIEVEDHPFFVASQYHPELKSRPNKPHPMFDGFINALTSENA